MPFDLQVIQIQDTRPGKKEALQLGVKQAKGDVLVFTDADCLPSGRHWLAHMMEAMNQGRGLVLGVSLPLLSRAPGLLGANRGKPSADDQPKIDPAGGQAFVILIGQLPNQPANIQPAGAGDD